MKVKKACILNLYAFFIIWQGGVINFPQKMLKGIVMIELLYKFSKSENMDKKQREKIP